MKITRTMTDAEKRLRFPHLYKPRGIGDRIEKLVKPIAVAAQKAGMIDCLDEKYQLKPESRCAKWRDSLNKRLRSESKPE